MLPFTGFDYFQLIVMRVRSAAAAQTRNLTEDKKQLVKEAASLRKGEE